MNVDQYLNRTYDYNSYNCANFVVDVWNELTGEDISQICQSFVNQEGDAYRSQVREYNRIPHPVDPCICLMRMADFPPHAGVYVQGRILHLTETGPKHDDISLLKMFRTLSFYR